ncbi:MAG TPA: DUF1343 domain-containing protein [Chitinispirillaceae bacterium]|nr:DUF1343 domain-containing protein [Chitinispirillaceae bacterium]
MTRFGLDMFVERYPSALKGKRIGIVCHAASICSSYGHIIDVLKKHSDCNLAAIFGPQHGLFGQTQDNMIEWEAEDSKKTEIPVYSLYGKVRIPTEEMLEGIDAIVFDLQDVGARPYTFVWTLKNIMDVCNRYGIELWVLDRPNPVGVLPADGPILSPEFFSFVGGAEIPLCHRLTMGEIAVWLKMHYFGSVDLNVVWMEGWWRNSTWNETGLPWVLPSPNMPTVDTAIVYPGMVLLEATNVSEGRGTTRPFELFGAPWINMSIFKKVLFSFELGGVVFREHHFIPTFQKWAGKYCYGMQIHVTNPKVFYSVKTTAAILHACIKASDGAFEFKNPPYEYEQIKMPFDILSGDTVMRKALGDKKAIEELFGQWDRSNNEFTEQFKQYAHYPEEKE